MDAKEARGRIDIAIEMRGMAEQIECNARAQVDVPVPGSIVREAGGSRRYYRVVEDPALGRTLDTLGDKGLIRGGIDWTRYDVVQAGDTAEVYARLDDWRKQEGMELPTRDVKEFMEPKTEKEKQSLVDLAKDPEFKSALRRAKKRRR